MVIYGMDYVRNISAKMIEGINDEHNMFLVFGDVSSMVQSNPVLQQVLDTSCLVSSVIAVAFFLSRRVASCPSSCRNRWISSWWSSVVTMMCCGNRSLFAGEVTRGWTIIAEHGAAQKTFLGHLVVSSGTDEPFFMKRRFSIQTVGAKFSLVSKAFIVFVLWPSQWRGTATRPEGTGCSWGSPPVPTRGCLW